MLDLRAPDCGGNVVFPSFASIRHSHLRRSRGARPTTICREWTETTATHVVHGKAYTRYVCAYRRWSVIIAPASFAVSRRRIFVYYFGATFQLQVVSTNNVVYIGAYLYVGHHHRYFAVDRPTERLPHMLPMGRLRRAYRRRSVVIKQRRDLSNKNLL